MMDRIEVAGRSAGDLSRRDVLKAAGLAALRVGIGPGRASASIPAPQGAAVILLMMVGGPSPFETFDPKPDAPSEIRGPFRAIETAVPGVRVSEHLPRIARRMGRLTLIRSLHHDAAPIHETGLQLIGTGRLAQDGIDHPHLGALAARALGPTGDMPPFAILPGPIGNTGVAVPRGQSAGHLGESFAPAYPRTDPAIDSERASTREAYGASAFGRHCLMARRMVEAGSRVVVVNMAETVFDRPSWDAHGRSPFATFDDLARTLLPDFDRGFSALIDDLEARGLLASTLVVATGEMGRTPRINESGGRDHWPGAWSAVLAGGASGSGQVIGATASRGGEPVDHPFAPADLFATMAGHLGLDPSATEGPRA